MKSAEILEKLKLAHENFVTMAGYVANEYDLDDDSILDAPSEDFMLALAVLDDLYEGYKHYLSGIALSAQSDGMNFVAKGREFEVGIYTEAKSFISENRDSVKRAHQTLEKMRSHAANFIDGIVSEAQKEANHKKPAGHTIKPK